MPRLVEAQAGDNPDISSIVTGTRLPGLSSLHDSNPINIIAFLSKLITHTRSVGSAFSNTVRASLTACVHIPIRCMDALVSINSTTRLPKGIWSPSTARRKNGREKANASRHNIRHLRIRSGRFSRRLRLLNLGTVVRKNINELNVTRLRVLRRIICSIIGRLIAAIPARNNG